MASTEKSDEQISDMKKIMTNSKYSNLTEEQSKV